MAQRLYQPGPVGAVTPAIVQNELDKISNALLVESEGPPAAIMAGAPDGQSVNGGRFQLQNWPNYIASSGFPGEIDAPAGTIMLPPGWWRLRADLLAEQGSNSQNFGTFLELEWQPAAQSVILDVFDVTTNNTDFRHYGAVRTFYSATAQTFSLWFRSDGNFGMATFHDGSFEMEQIG